ncbi:MAG TPA: redoxin family protein [Nitrosopumilaceae archaeon]|nr:redoxin family protein [Nitrosopumilaceae archaeon]
MRTELKTALMMGIVLAIVIGSASTYFSSLEQSITSGNQENAQTQTSDKDIVSSIDKSRFKKAPDLVGISGYINTTPEDLKLKMKDSVILYDIWTYSCINCIRTLPYITAWNEKYSDQGLLIIGIHSPEFEFEKDINNVKMAVQQYGITYPVVLDNDMKTWKAFENRYWPRKYIADSEGYIRYDHIGEGDYDKTEKMIQQLLEERNKLLGLKITTEQPLVNLQVHQFSPEQTPEIYFGYNFAIGRNQLGNSEGFKPENIVSYSLPTKFEKDHFYLEGQWKNFEDRMRLESENGKIVLTYFAKSVNIVAANESNLQVILDGNPVTPESAGYDVKDGILQVSGDRLYNIISTKEASAHTLTIVAQPGFDIYTFTFG